MKQLTDLEKKIRRRIAKASKRGRYLIVTRRGKRSRPGRKKGFRRCNVCNNFLSKDDVGVTCRSCVALIGIKQVLIEKIQFKSYPQAPKPFKMNIPKMTKGT